MFDTAVSDLRRQICQKSTGGSEFSEGHCRANKKFLSLTNRATHLCNISGVADSTKQASPTHVAYFFSETQDISL